MSKSKWIALFIIPLIFILQLALPGAAFADDSTPPLPAATEEPIATDETVAAIEPVATDEAVPTDLPVVDEESTVAEVFDQLPENTEIVIVNPDGSLEPLVTQDAVIAVVSGDPIWCPVGVAPQAGVGGCTNPGLGNSNYDPTSLQSLLTYLDANEPAQAGVIWIESSYDSSVNDAASSSFVIFSGNFTTMKDYGLTIQGGWSGVPGSTAIGSPSLFNGDHINISFWNAPVTINDIKVIGTNNHGITVQTTQDINLNNVESDNNTIAGADGAYLFSSTGKITLTGTNTFNNNANFGLYGTASGNISITGANIFNNNQKGLWVYSNTGTVTLNNVTANGNTSPTGYGAYVHSTISATITCSSFNNNAGFGVKTGSVATPTPLLTLNGVSFSGNTSGNIDHPGTLVTNASGCGGAEEEDGSGGNRPTQQALFFTIPLTQDQLPEGVGEGNAFGSALKLVFTDLGEEVENLSVTLTFPIPEGADIADLAVIFWNGSAWVEVPGGSVVDGKYVITVSEPGIYALIVK